MGFFDGLLDGITGSIGSIITGGISAGAGVVGGERANAASAKSAQQQMDFQRDMRNTAYQTAVEDMKKAGLNPAMMYNSGAGPAPTPVGSKYEARNTMEGVDKSVSSAVAMRQVGLNENMTQSQIDLNKANTANAIKQAENIAADTELKKANAGYISGPQSNTTDTQGALNTAHHKVAMKQLGLLDQQIEIAKSNATTAEAEARIRKMEAMSADLKAEMISKHPDAAKIATGLRYIGDAITPFR